MLVLLYAIRLNIAHKNNIKNQIQICRSNKTNKEIKKSFDIPTKSKKYILSNMKFYCIKETEKKKKMVESTMRKKQKMTQYTQDILDIKKPLKMFNKLKLQ